MSFLEIAILASAHALELKVPLEEFLSDLNADPAFRVLPLTYEIALEVASPGALRDPADRVIAATARVHRLRRISALSSPGFYR
jgi:PIN domain nuclease of toxin-antitoxin system